MNGCAEADGEQRDQPGDDERAGTQVPGAATHRTPTATGRRGAGSGAVTVDQAATPTKSRTATMLSTPPACQAHSTPRASPTATRRTSEACSSATGTTMTPRYGSGRRNTAGRITGACAITMEITKPRKMAWTTAS